MHIKYNFLFSLASFYFDFFYAQFDGFLPKNHFKWDYIYVDFKDYYVSIELKHWWFNEIKLICEPKV